MYRCAVLILLLAAAPIAGEPPETMTRMEMEQTLLARDLEVMGLTTGAARLIREGRTERALQLLEQRLASSLTAAGQRVDAGVRLPARGASSLLSAPGRAAAYATSQKQDVLAAQATALSSKLSDGSPRFKFELQH